jgi:hypothetical protein
MTYLRRPFLYSASMRSPSHSPARTSMGLRNHTTAISRSRSHCSCESRAGTRPVRFFFSPFVSLPYAGRGMGDESNTAVDMTEVYPPPNCVAIQIPRSYYTSVTCNQFRTDCKRMQGMNRHRYPMMLYHVTDVIGRVRYVGVTQYINNRWSCHKAEARRAMRGVIRARPFVAWLVRELKAGREPLMRAVRCAGVNWEATEKREIRKLTKRGEPLLNVA